MFKTMDDALQAQSDVNSAGDGGTADCMSDHDIEVDEWAEVPKDEAGTDEA